MTKEKISTCSATLDLVCTPIPNSAASKLVGNEAAMAIIRQSDFYMIGGRPQAFFSDFYHDPKTGRFHFTLEVAGGEKDSGSILLEQIPYIEQNPDDLDIQIKFGR